jgi:hypothetical protein
VAPYQNKGTSQPLGRPAAYYFWLRLADTGFALISGRIKARLGFHFNDRVKTMSEAIKYDGVPLTSQTSEHDEITARLRKRDEHLTRRLRFMRIVVRILDVGFGFSRS